MKPRDRSINIFSLSMLDVISGALGAFLIIMIVLFPYYNKESIDYQRQIEQLQQEVEQAQQQAQQAEQRAQEAERQLAQIRFLLVSIQWRTERQDVDLHVVDPSGAEFFYQQRTVPGRPGELTEDDVVGPGKEIWEILDAPPGAYRLYANLYDRKGNSQDPIIEGRVFYRDGIEELPRVRLTQQGAKTLIATVTIAEDGSVTFQVP